MVKLKRKECSLFFTVWVLERIENFLKIVMNVDKTKNLHLPLQWTQGNTNKQTFLNIIVNANHAPNIPTLLLTFTRPQTPLNTLMNVNNKVNNSANLPNDVVGIKQGVVRKGGVDPKYWPLPRLHLPVPGPFYSAPSFPFPSLYFLLD